MKKTSSIVIGLLFLCAGVFAYLLPATANFSAVPGDLADTRFNSVILEHIYRWVTMKDVYLWEPGFFYPYKGVLAFSDNHFGSALPYVMLRIFGLGREMAFSGWFSIGYILDYLAAFYVLRRLGLSEIGAAAGSFAFAFALPSLAQETHAQLIYRFAIPLAFLSLWMFLTARRAHYAWQCIVWVSVQFLCSIYLGVFLVYLLGAALASFLFFRVDKDFVTMHGIYKQKSIAVRSLTIVLALMTSFVTAWMLYRYFTISSAYGFQRSIEEIQSLMPRLASYLIADKAALSSWPGTLVKDIPSRNEQHLFLGFGVWGLMLLGLTSAFRKTSSVRPLATVAACSLMLLFLFTLFIGTWSPYLLFAHLPGVRAIRSVSRIILVMLMPVGLLVGMGVDALSRTIAPKQGIARMAILVGVLLTVSAEIMAFVPRNVPITVWIKRQRVLSSMLKQPVPMNGVLNFIPFDHHSSPIATLDAMVFAQDRGIKTINGYSGNVPHDYREPALGLSVHEWLRNCSMPSGWREKQIDALALKVVTLSPFPDYTFTRPQSSKACFGKPNDGVSYLLEGWSEPEDWGTWSLGKSSKLLLKLPAEASPDSGKPVILTIEFQTFDGRPEKPLVQYLSITGRETTFYSGLLESADSNNHKFSFPVSRSLFDQNGELVLQFNHPSAASPASFGLNTDGRLLAIGIKSAEMLYESDKNDKTTVKKR
jgi:hypothetical protein